MGDGTVVHAKGRDVGVVRESISKEGWNRYGRLNAFIADDNNVISRLLKKGKKGEDVRLVQQELMMLGYDLGKWGADGIFGSQTRNAVRKYQKDHKLKVDGIVGKQTTTALGLVWKG
ncbi:MAG: peptidoglycan-binding protein [Christensenellaceae bacterium]|nr:peptidoglycan-binding protein [Christensenellaceae bacterium]